MIGTVLMLTVIATVSLTIFYIVEEKWNKPLLGSH